MTQKHLLALLGFAFVAAWIAFTFGYALLCLVGLLATVSAVLVPIATSSAAGIDHGLGSVIAQTTQR